MDVFLFFSGEDRLTVRELKDALTAAGLKAFPGRGRHPVLAQHQRRRGAGAAPLEDDVDLLLGLVPHQGRPPVRTAHTHLSALRTGEIAKRLLVVNPEDPGQRLRRVGTTCRETSHLPNTSFVGRYRDRWRLHAALHIGDQPLVAATTAPPVTAHTLIAPAKGGTPGLVEHGVALLDRTSGSPTYADEVNRLALTYYDNRGEPASAAPFHEWLAELHPEEPSHPLNAARAHRQSGAPEAALAHLNRLTSTAHDSRTACTGKPREPPRSTTWADTWKPRLWTRGSHV